MNRSAFRFSNLFLGAGLVYFYLPILMVILFSFSSSKLLTVWSGFSWRWYQELFANERILEASLLSVRVALISATLATVIGVLAGVVLDRLGILKSRWLFVAMISILLVIPDTILGLSHALVFASLQKWVGWPSTRGELTLILSHCSLSLAYVAVLVRARLLSMDPAIEDAALDLGAKPWQALVTVTLPYAKPAIFAGWMLALSLSFDDLVVATFTSGPGATTLPLLIYSKIKLGVTPDINAIVTIIILVITLFVFICGLLWYRRAD